MTIEKKIEDLAKNIAAGNYLSDFSSYDAFVYEDLRTEDNYILWEPFEDWTPEDVAKEVVSLKEQISEGYRDLLSDLVAGIKELHAAIEKGDPEQIAALSIDLNRLVTEE
jgi:hypothetical protein